MRPVLLFLKSHVKGHTRRRPTGGMVFVTGYTNRKHKKAKRAKIVLRRPDERTGDLFQRDEGPAKDPDTLGVHGLTIRIENPRGSTRSKTPRSGGPTWQQTMHHHYGDIVGTKGADGDPIDVYVGPNLQASHIYVVNQHDKEGLFNEHKALVGFDSEHHAREGYLAHYPPGWNGARSIATLTPESFKKWLAHDPKNRPCVDC